MKSNKKQVWYLYVLECSDKTLYTGITNNFEKRIDAHTQGKGAKYTKGRAPFILKYLTMFSSQSDALKYEYKFKKWPKEEKEKHIFFHSNNRIALNVVIDLMKKEGWTTNGILDISPANNSTYVIWRKRNKTIYVGNYFLQSENFGAFPWKDPGVKEEHVKALLNSDLKLAYSY